MKEEAIQMKGFPALQQAGRRKSQVIDAKILKQDDRTLNNGEERGFLTKASSSVRQDLTAVNYPFHRLRKSFAEHSLMSLDSRSKKRFSLFPIPDQEASQSSFSSEKPSTSRTFLDIQNRQDGWSSWTVLAAQKTESIHKVDKVPIIQHFYNHPTLSTSVDESMVISPSLHPLTNVQSTQITTGQRVPWYVTVLQEKERCLMMLGEEINRLTKWEAECARKNDVISILREEIEHLQEQLDQQEDICMVEKDAVPEALGKAEQVKEIKEPVSVEEEELSDNEESSKLSHSTSDGAAEMELPFLSESLIDLFHLESKEESSKASTIMDEKEIKKQMEREKLLRTEAENLQKKNEELQAELEKVRHDSGIVTGTVTSLQRQLFLLEAKLRKTESEKEKVEQELKDRKIQLQAMSTKFSKLHDDRKHQELLAQIERENYNLRQHISELQLELEERDNQIKDWKAEIQKQERKTEEKQYQLRQCLLERKEMEDKVDALEHLEHRTKVSLEHVQARFERFRNKIVQSTYSSPGTKSPTIELHDGDVLDAMQKIITERLEYRLLLKQNGIKVPSPQIPDSSSSSPRQTPSKKSLGK
uniref:Coiled-coil domain-containing protein 27 n=1 Tax=Geotrypetes seraphini TaxID=260995 RepID=A0A6P8P961_GEOSA|nr:coiled-coil domain-containing protein 27 [Geotrypetes seraphini]XP_033777365.1 coiled-coil domain-containing protein 27 [Geotrypetes seraphini]